MGEKPQKSYENDSEGTIALPVLNLVPSPVSPTSTDEVVTPKCSYPEVSRLGLKLMRSVSSLLADALM
jgi:hypothetical protein